MTHKYSNYDSRVQLDSDKGNGDLIHHFDAVRSKRGPRLHLSGVVLPEDEAKDLWICDGLISFEPVKDVDIVIKNSWIMPGLVDAHNHIGLNALGPTDFEEAQYQARAERDAGVLLIRDAGSPIDTHWMDQRADLPKIIRAGRHIAREKRYIRNYAVEVEPPDLVAEVQRQARFGNGWVKLVGDWIDRSCGDLMPLWPSEVAKEAIDAAHSLGVKVTAHCFGEQSVTELVDSGIDGIEHGTGMSDETISKMAERQVGLVPTMINLENFPSIASQAEAKYPIYAGHMRALYARRLEVLLKAHQAGVPFFAGTDAGGMIPHGLIGDEIIQLGRIGGAEFALGAASWRARQWLGHPSIESGASADLVVYDTDPRQNLAVVQHPKHVVLRGKLY